MHHSLRLYNRHRELLLRYYIFQARWTAIPVVGRLVRRIANLYGRGLHGAYLLSPTEAEQIVDSSQYLALGPCTCRQVFRNCDNPIDTEILMAFSRDVFDVLLDEGPHNPREITKDEAKEVLRRCHEKGLIHTIVRCRQDFYAICSCCQCCCVPLRLSRDYGIGRAITRDAAIVEEFKAKSHEPTHSV